MTNSDKSITISAETKDRFLSYKIIPRESADAAINRMMDELDGYRGALE